MEQRWGLLTSMDRNFSIERAVLKSLANEDGASLIEKNIMQCMPSALYYIDPSACKTELEGI
eukprot:9806064-Lingulodinium_polyedra.AAC.1